MTVLCLSFGAKPTEHRRMSTNPYSTGRYTPAVESYVKVVAG
jgi:hypothetical protein